MREVEEHPLPIAEPADAHEFQHEPNDVAPDLVHGREHIILHRLHLRENSGTQEVKE